MKHLSFVEAGRALPSRAVLLRLSHHLDLPLRHRNLLLHAAGFASVYSEHALDDPAMAAQREAVDLVIRGHDPYPAFAVDGRWALVGKNKASAWFFDGVDASLLAADVNVFRLFLHPGGVLRRTRNAALWRGHLLERLRRQIDATGEPGLLALNQEFRSSADAQITSAAIAAYDGLVTPLELETDQGLLSLFATTTVFGGARDITLSELSLESFYPADKASQRLLLSRPAQDASPPLP